MDLKRKILLLLDLGGLSCHDSYADAFSFFHLLPWAGSIWDGARIQNRQELLCEMMASHKVSFRDTLYVGTGCQDIGALLKVRSKGGLAVVLNGNEEILNAASLALVADTFWPIALLVSVFAKWGSAGVSEMVKINRSPRELSHLMLPFPWQEVLTAGLEQSEFAFSNTPFVRKILKKRQTI